MASAHLDHAAGRLACKVLAGNPTLMQFRELEVLEKVSAGGKPNVALAKKDRAERVVNLPD